MRLTHILYKTNLSYGQTKKYLSVLHDMGLICELSSPYRSYLITEKGRTFIAIVGGELKVPGETGGFSEMETDSALLNR